MIFKSKETLKIKKHIFLKSVSLLLAAVLLASSVLGCQQQDIEEGQGDQNISEMYVCLTENIAARPVAERKADEEFVKALCDFSSELIQLSVHGTENIALSPTAIASSLLLMANGATSAAQSEIVGLFGGKISTSRFNEYMATYMTALRQENNCAL